MSRRIHGAVPDSHARGILAEVIVAFPVARRPDGSRGESTSAIGANVAQDRLDAGGAEGALVGADARFERFGRQGFVAMLARRTQLQHSISPASLEVRQTT